LQRREFMKTAAGAATLVAAPFVGDVRGANDRIVIGQIGLGPRGKYALALCQSLPDVRVAAICDVYKPLVDGTLPMLQQKADGYQDFRRVLERNDIDAVIVSTPDHWHAPICILACQASKDVYVEKPLTHTIEEGRRMVQAARKHGRVVQTGSQQHSAEHYRKIVELIRQGYIGKVTLVECWNVMNVCPEGLGNPPDSEPPAGLDWDLYLGPAPVRTYNRNRFVQTWRWFWDYGCGWATDWGAHHFDIIHWALDVDAPLAATAAGGKYCIQDNSETPDTLTACLKYPGFSARYTARWGNGRLLEGRPSGITFYGSKGTLVVDRSSYDVIPEIKSATPWDIDNVERTLRVELTNKPDIRVRDPVQPSRPLPMPLCQPIKQTGITIDPECQIAHMRNWLDCIRTRQRPVADVEIGHRVATACHLGVIAYKTGREIHWDREKETIIGDTEAQRLTSKTYRPPWTLPKV
jgi:predicted dehydrogenase